MARLNVVNLSRIIRRERRGANETPKRRGRKPGCLLRRKSPHDERAYDERQNGASVSIGEPPSRTKTNRANLSVDQIAHLSEEMRIAHGLRKDPHPTLGGDDIGLPVKLQRPIDIRDERIHALVINIHASTEAKQKVVQQRLEHLLLVFKVMVQKPRRHTSLCRHGPHRSASITMVSENARKGPKNLSASFRAIAWSSHFVSWSYNQFIRSILVP